MADNGKLGLFRHTLGWLLGLVGVMLAAGLVAREFNWIEGDPSWTTALIAVFFILAAMATFNKKFKAGPLFSTIAERLFGRVGNDS